MWMDLGKIANVEVAKIIIIAYTNNSYYTKELPRAFLKHHEKNLDTSVSLA